MKEYAVKDTQLPDNNIYLQRYPLFFQKLLIQRDLDTGEKIERFLNPQYETELHDPYKIEDMEKAVLRILEAVEHKQKIIIYSDYDADGIPAAVIMHDYFVAIGFQNFEVYIPHRHKEGFGLHKEAIETFIAKGINLIITLDCGIADREEVAFAEKAGIDVIVTDHHEPHREDDKDVLPNAYAVLNSKRADCNYPFTMLCGSGVAFKLVQALFEKNRFGVPAGKEKWLLDMAGLATLSDMVPLIGENRALAYYGLKVLRKSRRPGLMKLLSLIKTKQQFLTEDDIGFMVTPRINAASRMGVPLDAFNMLRAETETEGGMYAEHLDKINQERKVLVAQLGKEAKKMLSEREDHFRSVKVIVLGNPNWRPAILGLVANSIAEEYGKPVFLWGREDGIHIKGSCRSDGVTDLTKIMQNAKEAFIEYGGHTMSGGFAIHHEKIHSLETSLLAAAEIVMNETSLQSQTTFVDDILSLDDITSKNYSFLEKLAPFGMGNQKPIFLFKKSVITNVKHFGKNKEHLELCFNNSENKPIKAIAFFTTIEDFDRTIGVNTSIDLVATIEKSMFSYKPELRLRIVDII